MDYDCNDKNIMTRVEKEEFLDMFTPLIKKSLLNVPIQEREDLEQELKLKLLYKLDWLYKQDTPGFWEFAIEYQKRTVEQK